MMMYVRMWVFVWCLLAPAALWAATATASLDRSITAVGASVQLRLHVDGSADHDPELSVLQHDFDIISQSQSSNYSLINGSLSRSQQWQLSLMPKHTGTLTIPPISFGNAVTQAVTLTVTQQANASSHNRQVFLEMRANVRDVYVQAQTRVTVKLYRSVNLLQAQLTEPQAKHAIVKRLGKDKTYEAMRDGQRFVVTQRQYAVFPQQSGAMKMAGVVLNAQMDVGQGMFRQGGRVIRVVAPDVSLQVHPMPASWDVRHAWLPAHALTVQEIPDAASAAVLKVGEPITRIFEIRAHGLTAEQLPPLMTQTEVQGFKVYPDKPELRTEVDADGVVGIRREKIAMIPTQAGDVHLPELSVYWWNTETSKTEISTVLARSLHIEAASGVQGVSPKMVKPQVSPAKAAATLVPESPRKSPSSVQIQDSSSVRLWQAVSAVFLVLWLLTLSVWFARKSKVKRSQQHDDEQRRRTRKKVENDVKRACRQGSAPKVAQALLHWARIVYQRDDWTHIGQLNGLDETLDGLVEDLQKAMYARDGDEQAWDAQAVDTFVRHWKKVEKHEDAVAASHEVLKPL